MKKFTMILLALVMLCSNISALILDVAESSEEVTAANPHKAELASEELYYESLSRQIAAEGMVLLENKNEALPLTSNDTVAIFGKGAIYVDGSRDGFQIGGLGSSKVNAHYVVDIHDAMKNADTNGLVSIYEPLWDAYESNSAYAVTDEMYAAAAAEANTAVMVISRSSGEGTDRAAVKGDWYLTDAEEAMLTKLTAAFERVVVVANIASVIDMSWVEEYNIDALLVCWYPGSEGGNAVADILTGVTNPSGKLTTTFANSIEDYPSTEGFDNSDYTEYTEDIYMGYRYFETFDVPVKYEFGFGLSYTDFEITNLASSVADGVVTVTADVKNTGSVAGKEVVQVYYKAPQMKDGAVLGNPSKELAAYGKTSLLEPGMSESLTLTFNVSDMASFDDTGKTGNKSAMVLEAGAYEFYVGNSVKNAAKAGAYTVEETVVTEQLHQYVAPVDLTKRLLEDGSYEDMTAYTPEADTATAPTVEETAVKQTFDQTITLLDVRSGDATVDELVSQMTETELATFISGYGATLYGGEGSIGASNSVNNKYFMTRIETADGPLGLSISSKAVAWASETLVACTYNDELITRMGESLGEEAVDRGADILLAPGVNLHRNPLCGRNFEYYSEDPYLSGKMASAIVSGIQSKGVYAEIKHFAANEKELNRNQNDSRLSERALRELYLKPFEICIKEADPEYVMSSYNFINGTEASCRWDLLTGILRNEFGFDGVVTTDWANDSFQLNEFLAGCNVKMPSGDPNALVIAYNNGTVTRTQLVNNAVPIVESIAKSLKAPDVVTVNGDEVKIPAVDYIAATNITAAIDHISTVGKYDSRNNYISGSLSYAVYVEKAGWYEVGISARNYGYGSDDVLNVYVDNALCEHIYFGFPLRSGSYNEIKNAGAIYLDEGSHNIIIEAKNRFVNFDYFTLTETTEPEEVPQYFKHFTADGNVDENYGIYNSAAILIADDPRNPREDVYYIDAFQGTSYAGFSYWNKNGDLLFEKGHEYNISFEIYPINLNDDVTVPETDALLYMYADTVKSQSKYILQALGYVPFGEWSTVSKTFTVSEFENNADGRLDIYADPISSMGVNYYIDNIIIEDLTPVYTISFECDEEITGELPADIRVITSSPTATIPESDISKAGYTLIGWTDGTNKYAVSSSITVSSDTVLYPVWKEKNNDVFNFTADLGTSPGLSVMSAAISVVADPRNSSENVYYVAASSSSGIPGLFFDEEQYDNLNFVDGHTYQLSIDLYIDSVYGGDEVTSNTSAILLIENINGGLVYESIGSAAPKTWTTLTHTFTVNSQDLSAKWPLQIHVGKGVNYYADNFRLTDLTPVEDDSGYTVSFTSFEGYTGTLPESLMVESSVVIPESSLAYGGHTFIGWTDGNRIYKAGDTVTISANTEFLAVWRNKANVHEDNSFIFDGTREDFDYSSSNYNHPTAKSVTITKDPDYDKLVYKVEASSGMVYTAFQYANTRAGYPFIPGHKYDITVEYMAYGVGKEDWFDGTVTMYVNIMHDDTPHLISLGAVECGEWRTATSTITIPASYTPSDSDYISIYANPKNDSGVNYMISNFSVIDRTKMIYFEDELHSAGSLPETIEAAAGETVTIPDCSLEREGFYLYGWTDGESTYLPGDTLTVTNSVTLNAVWKDYSELYAPETADGVEIRVSSEDERNGIRFKASVKPSQKAASNEYGFIVAREDILSHLNAELTFDLSYDGIENPEGTLYAKGVAYLTDENGEVIKDIVYGSNEDGSENFTGVCVGIDIYDKNRVTTKLVARPYLVFKNAAGDDVIVYGSTAVSSLYGVASALKESADAGDRNAEIMYESAAYDGGNYIDDIINTANS